MKQFPKSLLQKLEQREANHALRQLPVANNLINFASNDYIGFLKMKPSFTKNNTISVR
jgi:8-amino-7-oxononanoate synthase